MNRAFVGLLLSVISFFVHTHPALAVALLPVPEIMLGTGVDTRSMTAKLHCIERAPLISHRTLETPELDGAFSNQFTAEFIQSAEDIVEHLDGELKASFGIGFFQSTAEAKFSRKFKMNKSYLYMLVKAETNRDYEALDPHEIHLTAGARLTWNLWGREAFYEKCGNEVVTTRRTGGRFLALVEIQTRTEDQKNEWGTKLSGSFMGLGGLDAKLNSEDLRKFREFKQRTQFITSGFTGENPEMTFESVIEFGRKFAENVARQKQPVVIEYYTKPWESVFHFQAMDKHNLKLGLEERFWRTISRYYFEANSTKNRLDSDWIRCTDQKRKAELKESLKGFESYLEWIQERVTRCLETEHLKNPDCRIDYDEIPPMPVHPDQAVKDLNDRRKEASFTYTNELFQRVTPNGKIKQDDLDEWVKRYFARTRSAELIHFDKRGLIQEIVRTQESYLEMVRFLSNHYFIRNLCGDEHWIQHCKKGSIAIWRDRIENMMGSPEFEGHYPGRDPFIDACYHYLCGRPGEKSGVAHWRAHYENCKRIPVQTPFGILQLEDPSGIPATRGRMLKDFVRCPEVRNTLFKRVFEHYLKRSPSHEEFHHWSHRFEKGRLDDLLIEILTTHYPDYEDPNEN